jgi:hypothetical protein
MSEMDLHIIPSARHMIKVRELDAVLDDVLREIQAIQPSSPEARKVEIEWEKDPEVEGWEMLSVTLWCKGSPEDARNLWRELDRGMKAYRQSLNETDLKKLNQLISVGVDIG